MLLISCFDSWEVTHDNRKYNQSDIKTGNIFRLLSWPRNKMSLFVSNFLDALSNIHVRPKCFGISRDRIILLILYRFTEIWWQVQGRYKKNEKRYCWIPIDTIHPNLLIVCVCYCLETVNWTKGRGKSCLRNWNCSWVLKIARVKCTCSYKYATATKTYVKVWPTQWMSNHCIQQPSSGFS